MKRHEEATGYRSQHELGLEAGAQDENGATRTDPESRSTPEELLEGIIRRARRLEAALERAELAAGAIARGGAR